MTKEQLIEIIEELENEKDDLLEELNYMYERVEILEEGE